MKINWNRKVAPLLITLQSEGHTLLGIRYPSGVVSAGGKTPRQHRQWIKHRIVQNGSAVVATDKVNFKVEINHETETVTITEQ